MRKPSTKPKKGWCWDYYYEIKTLIVLAFKKAYFYDFSLSNSVKKLEINYMWTDRF